MIGYNFTDRVRKVLQYAHAESQRLHHEYVGAEHILLGLLREGQSVAAAVLRDLKAEPDVVRARLEAALSPGDPRVHIGPDLPYTSQAKNVLECAMAEASALGYSYVGTEHLLLGLLRSKSKVVVGALAESGVTLDQARATALRLRAKDGPAVAPDGWPLGFSPPPAIAVPASPAGRQGRLALLLAVIALAVALVALGLALRAQP